jgi:hypothetical protein
MNQSFNRQFILTTYYINIGPHQRRTSFKSICKALEDALLQTEACSNGFSGTEHFFPLDQLTHSISLWI